MFGLRGRDQLPTVVLDEFENLVAGLSAFLLTAHNEDGTLISESPTSDVPTGALMDWTTLTAPTGWVLCDGRQLNRVEYKRLYEVIGVTYGVGDGSTTFNVPDIRGRFKIGLAAAGTGSVLAGTGGAIDHTHTLSGSTAAGTSGSDGAHDHGGATDTTSPGTNSTGAHTHTVSFTSSTSWTADGGPTTLSREDSDTTSSDGNHSHTVNSHAHGIDSDGAHTHSVPALAVGTLATAAANPPFIALPTIIKD